MKLSCFRSGSGRNVLQDLDDQHEAPKPPRPAFTSGERAKTSKSRILHRHGSADSRFSTCSSNESISKLPQCPRADPKVDALMMHVASEFCVPSKCLRLSQPKRYSDIVESMKIDKGSRNWRSFAVFEADEVDMSQSADEVAKKRAADHERKMQQLGSFSSWSPSDGQRHKSEHIIAQPYLTLLMPEPPSEQGKHLEARVEQIRWFNYCLFGRKSNKDWRSIPAVDDESLTEPLSPLLDSSERDAEELPLDQARSDS